MKYNDKPIHILIISMLVFIVLNIIENIIHYNNGKYNDNDKQNISVFFNLPSLKDFSIIVIVMLVFAFFQGFLTDLLSRIY